MNYFVFYYLVIMNIIGFFMMFSDKKRAINNKWRIRESSLLLIAILGGSIGCLIGMYKFRHKTKHIKFTFGIPLIILLQLFSLIVLVTT